MKYSDEEIPNKVIGNKVIGYKIDGTPVSINKTDIFCIQHTKFKHEYYESYTMRNGDRIDMYVYDDPREMLRRMIDKKYGGAIKYYERLEETDDYISKNQNEIIDYVIEKYRNANIDIDEIPTTFDRYVVSKFFSFSLKLYKRTDVMTKEILISWIQRALQDLQYYYRYKIEHELIIYI